MNAAPRNVLRHAKRAWFEIPAARQSKNIINLVDVGASRGLQYKWLPYARSIRPVLFEPNQEEAKKLSASLHRFHDPVVLDCGLSDRQGSAVLHMGESYGCTSLLEANINFLQDYKIAHIFRSTRSTEVHCCRYDELVAAGKAPKPDVIKIDVEGFEGNVLEGFGDLLDDVIAIETEAWFYEAYKGQDLLHDIIAKLFRRRLVLCRLESVPGFEGNLVCVNAFFARRARWSDQGDRGKREIVHRVLKLDPG